MATDYVYIMTNRTRRLYIGVTNNLQRRGYEHQHRLVPGFTSKYFLERLVYFEDTADVGAAIAREAGTQRLAPLQENRLDTEHNPQCSDLSQT